ncbi:integration host factor subunit alpha [Bacteriovoracaceae bacterium]|nr:integration host factor subunit alpha [Bacteriovoracaceae bacterium]
MSVSTDNKTSMDTTTLTKSEIIARIYKEVGFSKKEAAEIVDFIFKIIKDTLARGEKVKISGFGNFSIRDKATRVGRNPQTGNAMDISARRVLTFKPSQVLKEDVTQRYVHRIDKEGNEDMTVPPRDGDSRALSSFSGGGNDHGEYDD